MPFKALLTTALAVVALGGTIVIGKHIIESAPVNKLPIIKEPKNIKELLTKQGYKLLNTEEDTDNEKWAELIKKYIENEESKEVKNINDLKLKGTKTKPEEKEDIDALKSKCNELFEKPITKEDQEFNLTKQNTINWCTDPTNNSHRIISVR